MSENLNHDEIHSYKVYIHTNIANGKVYVGITCRDTRKRWGTDGSGYKGQIKFYNAIKKYGWDNFCHEIIVDNLTKNEAESLEISLIKKFDSTSDLYGYNVSNGGSSIGKHSHSTKKRIGDANRGEKNGMHGAVGSLNPSARKVVCLNDKTIFDTVLEGAKYYNIASEANILKCCVGERRSCGAKACGEKLVWRYYEDHMLMTENEIKCALKFPYEKISRPKVNKSYKMAKSVICLTTGEVFKSCGDACRHYNMSDHISANCKGERSYCGTSKEGFKLRWMYYDDYIQQTQINENEVKCL